jgi:succinate dehydrogenase/fumarate reductase-like Fe-S protein
MSFTLDMDSICGENKQSNDSQTKLPNTNIRKSYLGNVVQIFILHTTEINKELLVLKSKWVIKLKKKKNYKYEKEYWERKKKGVTVVIPVILHPVSSLTT